MFQFPSGISLDDFQHRVAALERDSHFEIIERNLFDEGPHLVSTGDLPWGDDVRNLAAETYMRFLHGETWLTGVGALAMQTEIVTWMGRLLGADHPTGFVTSGGTESNLCALLAASSRARRRGSVVFPEYGHYSLPKACSMFGFEPIIVPARQGSACDVDPAAIDAAIRDDTIAIVATAGTWAYGSVDPITRIGEIAETRGVHLHVDACFGGYILPFLERSGYDREIPLWDFRVPGVSSISADLHKNGMAPPPASTLFFRDDALLEAAKAMCPPNGTIAGTRGTGPIAGAWAMVTLLGEDGYTAVSLQTMKLRDRLFSGVEAIDGVQIYPGSRINVSLLFSDELDLSHVVAELRTKGWMFSTRNHPRNVAMVLVPMPQNERAIDPFLEDLETAMSLASPLRRISETESGDSPYGV